MASQIPVQRSAVIRLGRKSVVRDLVPGTLMLLSAVPVAYLIYLINETFPNQPERAAQIVGGLFVFLFIIPPAVYLLFQRRSTKPGKLALIILASIGVLLVSIYLYRVSSYIKFPADILLWSESDFVNDILKFRAGYPIYTEQVNNESFIYTPGSQMMTYLLAWLFGAPTSIPLYRFIQIIYALLASIISLICCRKLIGISQSDRGLIKWSLWGLVCLPILFLLATNSLTNPYVHNLHNDALALLISMTAYWLLLEYISTKEKWVLALMAIIPAAGFLVKQSLAIWAPIYLGYLAFFEKTTLLASDGNIYHGFFWLHGCSGGCLLYGLGRTFHLLGIYRYGETPKLVIEECPAYHGCVGLFCYWSTGRAHSSSKKTF